MLMSSKHLMPYEDKKEPYYIVMELYKNDESKSYVKNYGTQKFPTSIDDSIIEMTPNLCDAIMFCRKEDAEKVAMKCTFKCNCGCIHHVGKLIKVTRSNRKEEGVTYGHIKNWDEGEDVKKHYFEVVFNYKELSKEYKSNCEALL